MFPDVNKVLLGLQAAIFVPGFTLLYSNTRYDYTHDTRTIVEEYKNTGVYAAIQKYTTLLTVYSIQYTEHRTHLDDRDDYDDNLPPTPSTTPPPPSKHWHQRSPVPSYPPNRSLPTHPSNTTSNASNTSTSTSNTSIPSSFLPLYPPIMHALCHPSMHLQATTMTTSHKQTPAQSPHTPIQHPTRPPLPRKHAPAAHPTDAVPPSIGRQRQ